MGLDVGAPWNRDSSTDPSAESLSQQTHRQLVGYLGFSLPFLLYIFAGVLPTAGLTPWKLLTSVSAYYYTGGVTFFIGVLFALALFLLTYPGYKNFIADRVLGIVGGIAAIFVALFPTNPPGSLVPASWWRPWMAVLHYLSAVTLFVSFILFAIWLFRKSNIPDRRARPPDKRRRDAICLACGLVMIASVLWAGSSMFTGAPIFWPESIAIGAFAISWLTKGEARKTMMKMIHTVRQKMSASTATVLVAIVLSGPLRTPSVEQTTQGATAQYPAPVQGDFVLEHFIFRSGDTLPELRMHYRTLGAPVRDGQGVVRNAVLIMHGTGGSGAQFLRPEFAGELFVPNGLLDARRYFIILPDGIGHGQSSKPSDGMRGRFPHYGYLDMVDAVHRLLVEGLKVNHLRLVMGTSMGGMQTWLWGERYNNFMDALMPLASLPTQISGRNRVWRRVVIDAIRHDPAWRGGDYTAEPPALRTAEEMLYLMGSNPVLRQQQMPTLAASDSVLDAAVATSLAHADANDLLYQVDASRDYDPGPALELIRAPLIAVNSADDLINPPELGILERDIKRVPQGRAVVIPFGPQTRGHGTHTIAAVWKQYLAELLR